MWRRRQAPHHDNMQKVWSDEVSLELGELLP